MIQPNSDLNIKLNNNIVTGTISNIVDHPPTVELSVKAYMGSEFIWLPDPNGNIDIASLDRIIDLPPDSIVYFGLRHKNAY